MCWSSQLYILQCIVFVIQFTVFSQRKEVHVCRQPEKLKYPLWIQNTVRLHFFKGQNYDLYYKETVITDDSPGLFVK